MRSLSPSPYLTRLVLLQQNAPSNSRAIQVARLNGSRFTYPATELLCSAARDMTTVEQGPIPAASAYGVTICIRTSYGWLSINATTLSLSLST